MPCQWYAWFMPASNPPDGPDHAEVKRLRSVVRVRDREVAALRERVAALEQASAAAKNATAEREQRLRLLAGASELLSSSLDSRQAIAELARMVVPSIADWCGVDEVAPDGSIRRIALEHRDPEMIKVGEEFSRRYPQQADSPRGVSLVLRTGQTDWFPDIPDALLESSAIDAEHLALMRKLQLASYAVVAIRARRKILGTLTLVSGGPRRVSREDVEFAEELARRAGLALENARLYEASELARSELFDLVMNVPATIAWFRGRDLRYHLLNKYGRELVGRDDIIGKPLAEVFPTLPSAMIARLQTVFDTGLPFVGHDARLVLNGGLEQERYLDLVYLPTRDAAGTIDGLATFAFDVTAQTLARRRLEARAGDLAHSDARMRSLVDAIGAMVWIAGADGSPKEVSDAWIGFTGQSAADYARDGFLGAVHPDDREGIRSAWVPAVAAGERFTANVRLVRADGASSVVAAVAVPVRGEGGAVLEFLGCALPPG
jgi:PAS domain-containing protein